MPPTVLRVALPLPRPGLFDYLPRVPTDLNEAVGVRVKVPFGSGERVGVVTEVGPAARDRAALKAIHARLDSTPLLQGELLETLIRCANYYHAPLGELLATAMPTMLREGGALPVSERRVWQLSATGRAGRMTLRARGRPRQLVDLLLAGPLDEAELNSQLAGWRPAARALLAKAWLEPAAGSPQALRAAAIEGPGLNPEQAASVAAIKSLLGEFQSVLLEGVTGSGKTEVYLRVIAECLARGQQALVLVPEIGLTPQTLRRFQQRLGIEVHSLHSGMADGARARVWAAMRRGDARVLIGTRSAVFCPLPNAGVIVVDEEHDSSYKQQDGVRYSARDVALLRGQALRLPVILGSATPSLETLAAARAGRYRHLHLHHRAGGAQPPTVQVLDVRRQRLQAGLSSELLAALHECLDRGEQALIFRNRRGYAPALLCHDCGHTAMCRHCDAPMTVHQAGRRLICHHCGHTEATARACPDCGSLALQPQGVGTERLEEALAAAFPDAPCLRVDRETTRGRDGLARVLAELGERPGILVGTQMLAKGHDLAGLSLVGVVGVDEGLYSADFRAGERLAQLLIQVAGRAGRASRPGHVILQTHHPAHPLLTTLIAGGYAAFAEIELAERQAAGFPPYAHLALLRAEATEEAAAQAFLQAARASVESLIGRGKTAEIAVNGPLAAPMLRRAGRYRWQLLLSATRRPALQALLGAWTPSLYALKIARRVRWSLDVDPVDLF